MTGMGGGNSPDAQTAAYTTHRNEEDWFVVRSHAELGGRVYVDATEQMTPGLIDLSITSVKGASAACAIPKAAALALAEELRRVGEPDWSVRLTRLRHRVLYPMVVVAAAVWLVRQLIA